MTDSHRMSLGNCHNFRIFVFLLFANGSKMIEYIDLETDRLILNRFTIADAPKVQAMAGDIAVASTCLLPHPYLDGMAEQWINSHEQGIASNTEYIWAIRLKENNELIGTVGIIFDDKNKIGEVGYWIGAEYHNQQYGREALQVVVKFAVVTEYFNKLIAKCFSRNYPSIAILDWCGFQPEGRHRKHIFHLDKFEDSLSYGLLIEDYMKRFQD